MPRQFSHVSRVRYRPATEVIQHGPHRITSLVYYQENPTPAHMLSEKGFSIFEFFSLYFREIIEFINNFDLIKAEDRRKTSR